MQFLESPFFQLILIQASFWLVKKMKNRHIYLYPHCEEEQNMIKSQDSLVNDFE